MNTKQYLKLPYHITIQYLEEDGGYYFASVNELDGCVSHGETFEEAHDNILEAMEGWIETKLAHGFPVPPPFKEGSYSGKFVVRIPKTLHARLAEEASREGVSLNQYALYKLSV